LEEEEDKIYNLSMTPLNRSRDYYMLVDKFYQEFELDAIEKLENDKNKKILALEKKIKEKEKAQLRKL
jgi:uncharacterized protein (UPF0262 family)